MLVFLVLEQLEDHFGPEFLAVELVFQASEGVQHRQILNRRISINNLFKKLIPIAASSTDAAFSDEHKLDFALS